MEAVIQPRWVFMAVLAAAIAAAPTASLAAPDPHDATLVAATLPPIVLEAHVGERTPEAIAALSPVLDELEQRGYAANVHSIDKALGGEAPRPGILDVGTTSAGIAQEVEIGVAFFEQGKFKEAEGALSAAVRHLKRNPSLVALDTNEKALINAFVHLAMSQDKLKRTTEARETMVELQRMSSTPPDHFEYGPRAEELYRSSQRPAQTRGRGFLKVTVSEPNAMIFLDNRYRGLGRLSLADVVPGPHSLLVQVPGTEGRQYGLEVRANETAELSIDWQTDSKLHIAPPWAGFRFASEGDREREATYARQLAQRWARRSVIVLGPTRINGVPVLLGVAYPAAGEPSGAFVPLNSGAQRLRELARFLVDGTVSDGVNVLAAGPRPGIAAGAPSPSGRRSVLPAALATTAAVVTIAGGAASYMTKHYDPTTAMDDGKDDGKGPAVVVMVGGSAIVGGSVYLWLREARSTSRLTAGLLGAGVAALAAGAVLYVTDQDPGPPLPPLIRNSAPTGVALGVSGIALAGLGAWFLYREEAPASLRLGQRAAPWSPVVLVRSSTALVGCSGSF